MNVTNKIDAILHERNMSRRQLAIEAGISPSTFQAAMARGKNMTVDMLQAVSDTLQIPITYFFTDAPAAISNSNKEILGIFSFLTTSSDKVGQWVKALTMLYKVLETETFTDSAAEYIKPIIEIMQGIDPEAPYKLRENYKRWSHEFEQLVTPYQGLNAIGRRIAIERLTELTKIPDYQQKND